MRPEGPPLRVTPPVVPVLTLNPSPKTEEARLLKVRLKVGELPTW